MSDSNEVSGPVDGGADDDQEVILDIDGNRIDSDYINRAMTDVLEEDPPPAPADE